MKKFLLIFCGILCAINAFAQASGGEIIRKKSNNQVQSSRKLTAQRQFVVTNAKEFLDAIGSNREIIVKSSNPIDLTDEMVKRLNDGTVIEHKLEKSIAKGLYADWGWGGPGLVFAGLNNLTIKGLYKNTKITVESAQWAVIRLSKCSNVKFEQLVLGHNNGTCYGPVIQVDTCNSISILSSGLFGCGTIGLAIDESNNILCKNTQIYSCRENIVWIGGNTKHVHFSDCNIYDISSGFFINKGVNDVMLTRCKINRIRGNLFSKVESKLLLDNCQITHEKEKTGDMKNVVLKNCKWITPVSKKSSPAQGELL